MTSIKHSNAVHQKYQRFGNIRALLLISVLPAFVLCSCINPVSPSVKISIVKSDSRLSQTIIVSNQNDLFGLDSSDFTVHIQVKYDQCLYYAGGMSSDNTIAFANEGYGASSSSPNELLVMNDNCEIVKTIKNVSYPYSAFILNDNIFSSSLAIESGRSRLYVYDARNYTAKRSFLLNDVVHEDQYLTANGNGYFALMGATGDSTTQQSTVLQINLQTLDTSTVWQLTARGSFDRFGTCFDSSRFIAVSFLDPTVEEFSFSQTTPISTTPMRETISTQIWQPAQLDSTQIYSVAFAPHVLANKLYIVVADLRANGRTYQKILVLDSRSYTYLAQLDIGLTYHIDQNNIRYVNPSTFIADTDKNAFVVYSITEGRIIKTIPY